MDDGLHFKNINILSEQLVKRREQVSLHDERHMKNKLNYSKSSGFVKIDEVRNAQRVWKIFKLHTLCASWRGRETPN